MRFLFFSKSSAIWNPLRSSPMQLHMLETRPEWFGNCTHPIGNIPQAKII
jgi:hypothetical protein